MTTLSTENNQNSGSEMLDVAAAKRERRNERQRRWVQRNRERFNAYRRNLRANNPKYKETEKRWLEKNAERIEENRKAYYLKNGDKMRAHTSDYQRENSIKMNETHNCYRHSKERIEITRMESRIRVNLKDGTDSPRVFEKSGWEMSDYRKRLNELCPGYFYGKVGFGFENYLSDIEGRSLHEIFSPDRMYIIPYDENGKRIYDYQLAKQ